MMYNTNGDSIQLIHSAEQHHQDMAIPKLQRKNWTCTEAEKETNNIAKIYIHVYKCIESISILFYINISLFYFSSFT